LRVADIQVGIVQVEIWIEKGEELSGFCEDGCDVLSVCNT